MTATETAIISQARVRRPTLTVTREDHIRAQATLTYLRDMGMPDYDAILIIDGKWPSRELSDRLKRSRYDDGIAREARATFEGVVRGEIEVTP